MSVRKDRNCNVKWGEVSVAETQSDWQDGRVQVVLNHDGQYSLWPAERKPLAGWRATGKTGLKDECLAHIAEVWVDMRPLSIRG
jgi:MbtH protein